MKGDLGYYPQEFVNKVTILSDVYDETNLPMVFTIPVYSEKYPDKTIELKELWENWAEKNNVYPLDGRGWKEKADANILK